MRDTFHFYSDPAHGWLKVAIDYLRPLNLSISDFSQFSYRGHEFLYLEEDCDMALLLAAYKAKHGVEPTIVEHHSNGRSMVRSYARLPDSGATFAQRCAKLASFRSVEA
jgi:hypothetical protein